MTRLFLSIALLTTIALAGDTATAQLVTYYSPVVPTYAAPAPVMAYRPVYQSAYQPVQQVAYQPVALPAPTVVYRPAPAPMVTATTVARVPVAVSRYRPLLGGTVTRYRTGYAPVTVAYPAW